MAQSHQARQAVETTVDVRATEHVRDALGTPQPSFTFGGDILRAFVEALFVEHDVQELVIAEADGEAVTSGWAPIEGDDVPGDLRKNPEDERTRAYENFDQRCVQRDAVGLRHDPLRRRPGRLGESVSVLRVGASGM